MARRASILIGALAALGPALSAHAATPVQFRYVRAAGTEACPDAAAVAQGVRDRVGGDPFRDDASLAIAVTISRAGSGLIARLVLTARSGSSGERVLSAPSGDCAELVRAIVLAISIAIDPLRVLGTTEVKTATTTPARTPEPPARTPLHPGGTGTVDTARDTLLYRGRAGLVLSAGAAPDLALGFRAGLSGTASGLSLALELRVDLPASTDVAGGGRASTSLIMGSLVPCVMIDALSACAVASAGVLRGEGESLQAARSVTAPYVALGARVSVELFSFGVTALELDAELDAPLVRTTLTASDMEVWSAPRLSGSAGISVVSNFS